MKFLPSLLSFFSIYLLVPSTNNTYCEVAQQTRMARMIQKSFASFFSYRVFCSFQFAAQVNACLSTYWRISCKCFWHLRTKCRLIIVKRKKRITEIRRRCSPLFFTKATLYEVLSSHYHLGFPARHFSARKLSWALPLLTQTLKWGGVRKMFVKIWANFSSYDPSSYFIKIPVVDSTGRWRLWHKCTYCRVTHILWRPES